MQENQLRCWAIDYQIERSSAMAMDKAYEVLKDREKMVNLVVLGMGGIRIDRACKLDCHPTLTI